MNVFLEMDSQEEKLQKIIMESKMSEAKRQAQLKADEIEKRKQHAREMGISKYGYGSDSMEGGNEDEDGHGGGGHGGGGGYGGRASGAGGGGGGDDYAQGPSAAQQQAERYAGGVCACVCDVRASHWTNT